MVAMVVLLMVRIVEKVFLMAMVVLLMAMIVKMVFLMAMVVLLVFRMALFKLQRLLIGFVSGSQDDIFGGLIMVAVLSFSRTYYVFLPIVPQDRGSKAGDQLQGDDEV